jgi:hypothetical protein
MYSKTVALGSGTETSRVRVGSPRLEGTSITPLARVAPDNMEIARRKRMTRFFMKFLFTRCVLIPNWGH